jgi:hypothetical protein
MSITVIQGRFAPRREVKMWSDTAGKPVYLENVDWSDLGLREREKNEPVHVREEQYDPCLVCGSRTGVFVVTESTHATHRDRCK